MKKNFHIFRFIRFCCVGVITAIIYFMVMWLVVLAFPSHYIVAVTLAYAASTMFHYFANRSYTFDGGVGCDIPQVSRYIVLWAVNYFVTILVVRISVVTYLLSPYLGVCISVIFTVITGYVLGHYWVFKIKKQDLCPQ